MTHLPDEAAPNSKYKIGSDCEHPAGMMSWRREESERESNSDLKFSKTSGNEDERLLVRSPITNKIFNNFDAASS